MHVALKWILLRINDMHHNKGLKLTRFKCPQNFLLPMTLK